jgi:DNA-binding NarL/FixJ family response regulator
MSKKRLRAGLEARGLARLAATKHDSRYWRERLFKCRYTYKRKQFEVRHWSVKIQHEGQRRTFALHSGRRAEAAAEACELYQSLLAHGWKSLIARNGRKLAPAPVVPALADRFDTHYWAKRLIRRQYTMSPRPGTTQEVSVRIDHAGAGQYFPLGTDNHRLAATRALRIYQTIVGDGWATAGKRFSRELTIAFRWLDVPLAWTYTTIHTLPDAPSFTAAQLPPSPPLEWRRPGHAAPASRDASADSFRVSVVESDAGIRQALEWCVNRMDGFRCAAVYASAAEALRESPRQRVHLALISHNLADQPGPVCLAELKAVAPQTAGLLYSVYEDSEELFRATPGGAGTYLLRRTLPHQFLDPVAGRLQSGPLLADELAPAAWQYFKDSVASMPVGQSARQLANLTQREHEVLALLSKGHPDKDIADRLGISIYTVHEHVRNVFEKLGAHNRTEAAVKFLQK